MVVLLSLTACSQSSLTVGELATLNKTIERGDIETLTVDLLIGLGELNVSGGATGPVDVESTYNVPGLKPEATYNVNGSAGYLSIHPPKDVDLTDIPKGLRYELNIKLNDNVPTDLIVETGAGGGNLSLETLTLNSLDLETGLGRVEVKVGDSSPTLLQVETGGGEVSVDMVGDWQNSLNAHFNTGVGGLNLQLPSSVGVRVVVDKGLGDVNAKGLTQSGNQFTNDAYGQSDITLFITIDGGAGTINLEVE